jgi:hypothetical protein
MTRYGLFVYNAGDFPIKPKITLKRLLDENIYTGNDNVILNLYSLDEWFSPIQSIELSKNLLTQCKKNQEQNIILDSKLKMLKGVQLKENEKENLTGYIYNKFHKSGDYF